MISVEGEGGNAGLADRVFNLSSLSLGSNGLLVIDSSVASHTIPPETTVLTNSNFDTGGGALENGSNSFLVVFSPTAIATRNLDTNNDGIHLPAGAVLLDGVGFATNPTANRAYDRDSRSHEPRPAAPSHPLHTTVRGTQPA